MRARIDSVFARFDRPSSPGCVATVMSAGDIVFSRGYGRANLATGERLTRATAFDGASMAKQFLAFSIALLASEGKLSLDDPVHRHLPELPDYGAPVTLRHLVHHTSGLRDWDAIGLSGRPDLKPWTLPGLSFAPGTGHMYDDTGYALLERVLERVSGQRSGEFQRARIFEPLGMTRTAVTIPRARPYHPRDGGGFREGRYRPDEGFTVTAEDLAKWDRNFYDARVGGPEVIRMMLTDGRLNSGETVPYAMALHTEPYRGLRRNWHGGLSGGYRSQLMRFPDQRTSVLVQCNVFQLAEPNALAERVADIVLADAIARAEAATGATASAAPAPPPTAAEMARLAGIYLSRGEQASRTVRVSEGRLEMRQWITWLPLRPLGGGRFRVEGQPLTVVLRDGTLEEHWDGRRTPVVLAAEPPPAHTAAALDAYTGRFHSRELGTTWTIVRTGRTLRVVDGASWEMEQRPAGRDAFTDDYTILLFRRDSAGRVTGFTAATPRVRSLEFVRRG